MVQPENIPTSTLCHSDVIDLDETHVELVVIVHAPRNPILQICLPSALRSQCSRCWRESWSAVLLVVDVLGIFYLWDPDPQVSTAAPLSLFSR